MSNQISLTIPNDDPIALRAFGNALEEMAVAHGAEVRKSDTPSDIPRSRLQPPFDPDCVSVLLNGEPMFVQSVDNDDNHISTVDMSADDTDDDDTQLATNDTLDADGLPWDARIHSGNQERNADNTWRARRKPKELTPEQWEEQVEQVRDELFALMAIPVEHPEPVVDDESPAEVFGTSEPVELPPEPVELPTVAVDVPPAPPIADPVPPAPAPLPPVTAADGVPATLAELMTWLTKKAPSDDAGRAKRLEQINGIVARHGLVALGQLQKRLDLIPQVYADLVKELGV